MSKLLEKGLPANLDAERFVLGSILLDDSLFVQVAGAIQSGDFILEKHRVLFNRMGGLYERGERIDRVTVYNELVKNREADACDGLSYLISLDDGLPRIANVDAYVRIVRENADLRRVIFLCERTKDRALLGQEDASALKASLLAEMLESGERGGDAQTVRQVIEEENGMEGFFDRSAAGGLETGFSDLDRRTNGLRAGDLFVLAGRPSQGKTALALNIAANVARGGKHVAIFSLESRKQSVIDRLLAANARVNLQRIRKGDLDQEARGDINACIHPLLETVHICDTFAVNVMDIHAQCRRIKARTGLALVVVDYLQLVAAREGGHRSRNDEVAVISRALKLMAGDLSIPVIVLSQLSRACEARQEGGHRPQLSDLRDSGSIEQDADLVGFIYRPEVYFPDKPEYRHKAELILAKQRDGEIGRIHLRFSKEIVRFDPATDARDGEKPRD